jgi:pimeloyl-ACP methyl ester carboxylesterase
MRRRTVVGGLVVAAGAAGALAAARAVRRWKAGEGVGLSLAEGEDRVVVSTDGAQLEVRIAGPADAERTFVLAHGWTNDRRVWGAVSQRLVDEGHRVVTWNQRGHGASTVGSKGHTVEALGDDVRVVLEDIDARDVVLAGHSMGGMASMAFLTEHPDQRERVGAVALVSTTAGGLTRGAVANRIAAQVIAHPALDRAMRSGQLGPFLVRNTVGRTVALSHLDAMRELFVATSPDVRAGFLNAMTAMDLTDGIRALDVPTLVLVGSRDRLTPVALSRRLAATIPGARLEVLEGFGHMLPLEAPDLVAERLLSLPVLGVLEVEATAGVPR